MVRTSIGVERSLTQGFQFTRSRESPSPQERAALYVDHSFVYAGPSTHPTFRRMSPVRRGTRPRNERKSAGCLFVTGAGMWGDMLFGEANVHRLRQMNSESRLSSRIWPFSRNECATLSTIGLSTRSRCINSACSRCRGAGYQPKGLRRRRELGRQRP